MFYSIEEKAIIKNHFIEKESSSYHVCKDHPTKNRDKVSVQRFLSSFKMQGSMNMRPGSGRSRMTTPEENEER